MRTRCCAVPFLAALLLYLPATWAADKNKTPSVDDLIARLSSCKYAERQAADRALESLGVAALPALEKAARGADAETRRRAEILIQRIEKHAETTRLLTAKPI